MTIKQIAYPIVTAAFICGMTISLTGCHKEANELAHHHHHGHGHEHEHEHEEGHEHNHDVEHEHSEHEHDHDAHGESSHASSGKEISITPERAKELEIETTEITPSDFYTTLEVSGELTASPAEQAVITARSAGIVTLSAGITPGVYIAKGNAIASISGKGMAGGDANEAAQVALTAAKRELDRLTPLHKDGIVSTRDYNAALQVYEAAKAACGTSTASAGSAATAPNSGVITQIMVNDGQFVVAGTPIAAISGNNRLTLKANLPERHLRFFSSINGAKFRTSYSNEILDIAQFNGHRSSDTKSAVAIQGYIPVCFTLTNDGTLSSGSFCQVYLTGNKRTDVLSVPISAISEQQGEFFVFVRLDEDCYEKRHIKKGASQGDAVEIISGLHAGENVVTQGTTFVRLAESSSVVPEGHSHNH